MDLPQIVVPPFLYNALICALATAASWHAMTVAISVVRKLRRTTPD